MAKVCCNSTEDLCTTKVLELLATATNDDEMISYMTPLNRNANEVYVFSPGKDATKKGRLIRRRVHR